MVVNGEQGAARLCAHPFSSSLQSKMTLFQEKTNPPSMVPSLSPSDPMMNHYLTVTCQPIHGLHGIGKGRRQTVSTTADSLNSEGQTYAQEDVSETEMS